ncbi:MAG TPA: sugar phosphate isomerase/epimerase family protein [Bryobacteraceae bacterium]|nr:sugar phosphate isomerase/epimerase family protein [Bryobacteraceae bacterium]
MNPKIPIAAITDEFSPDLDIALTAMREIGMTAAELRVIDGRNIMDLSADELDRTADTLTARGFKVVSIASPVFKCSLPNSPPIDSRFQQDVFAAKHTYDDQPSLADHAFDIAEKFGARIIRVFSFWRTVDPSACFDPIVSELHKLAVKAAARNLIIGLENEHACNIATAQETSRVLQAVQHPNLKVVWDPANAYVAGENPFPDGYRLLSPDRIVHVHAKDCHLDGHTPVWGPLGTRNIDWKGQIAALLKDRYSGYLSLETHWPGPGGDKLEASRICGWNLKGLASA